MFRNEVYDGMDSGHGKIWLCPECGAEKSDPDELCEECGVCPLCGNTDKDVTLLRDDRYNLYCCLECGWISDPVWKRLTEKKAV